MRLLISCWGSTSPIMFPFLRSLASVQDAKTGLDIQVVSNQHSLMSSSQVDIGRFIYLSTYLTIYRSISLSLPLSFVVSFLCGVFLCLFLSFGGCFYLSFFFLTTLECVNNHSLLSSVFLFNLSHRESSTCLPRQSRNKFPMQELITTSTWSPIKWPILVCLNCSVFAIYVTLQWISVFFCFFFCHFSV